MTTIVSKGLESAWNRGENARAKNGGPDHDNHAADGNAEKQPVLG